MWIKICANTCVADALKAAELGADAVGFVFAPSSRQVTVAQARAISEAMPEGVDRVGVFGMALAQEIAEAAIAAKLTAIQLHAGFRRAVSVRLRELIPQVRLIETVHWRTENSPASERREIAERLREIADYAPEGQTLVDAKVGGVSGGTGSRFDWGCAKEALSSPSGARIVLAGGLRPENVVDAIQTLRPWGVDVASGVERVPGRKDFVRLRDFIRQARAA